MDIRLAVAVFAVLLSQVHGFPQRVEDADVSSSEDSEKTVPLEGVSFMKQLKKLAPMEEVKGVNTPKEVKKTILLEDVKDVSTPKEVKKTIAEEKEESSEKLRVHLTSLGAKLKAHLLQDGSKEVQDDTVRATRQSPAPPFHQMSFGKGPIATTVCIRIHSGHQPEVVCGPQIADKDAQGPAPAAARFSNPFDFARSPPEPFPQRYAQGPPQGSPMGPSPAAGSGFPMKRTEDDPTSRPSDLGFQPASGYGPQHPVQISPAASPGPVYVHRQYYQPLAVGAVHPTSAQMMRLNCILEPGGQILSPQFINGGEEVFTLPDGSPARYGPNVVIAPPHRSQNSFSNSQAARSASEVDLSYLSPEMFGSSQNYGAYPEEAPLDMMTGRSADSTGGGQYFVEYPGPAQSPEEFARRENILLHTLRASKNAINEIQKQLVDFRERLQMNLSANSSNPEVSGDPNSTPPAIISLEIKDKPEKARKRQARSK